MSVNLKLQERGIIDSEQKIPVFVYGTLKSMSRGRLIGPASTIHKFFMFDGSYPVVWDGTYPSHTLRPYAPFENKARVKGEAYYVSTREFQALDAYEGYPDLYIRDMIEVKVDLGGGESTIIKAWMYLSPKDGTGCYETLNRRKSIEPDELGYLQWPPIPF